MPPRLAGDATLLVQVSGVAEVVGGLGVLCARTRRPAGLWLIAAARGGVPGEPLYGPGARALPQDPPLGAVWAAAAAAADDVVGVEGHAAMNGDRGEARFYAAMFD